MTREFFRALLKSCPSPDLHRSGFSAVLQSARKHKEARLRAPREQIKTSLLRPYRKQFLSVLDWLPVAGQFFNDFARDVGFDFVEQFHSFDDAQHLPHFDGIPNLDERRGSRRRSFVERPHDRGLDRLQGFLRRWRWG